MLSGMGAHMPGRRARRYGAGSGKVLQGCICPEVAGRVSAGLRGGAGGGAAVAVRLSMPTGPPSCGGPEPSPGPNTGDLVTAAHRQLPGWEDRPGPGQPQHSGCFVDTGMQSVAWLAWASSENKSWLSVLCATGLIKSAARETGYCPCGPPGQ
jgi:hypothetical protein